MKNQTPDGPLMGIDPMNISRKTRTPTHVEVGHGDAHRLVAGGQGLGGGGQVRRVDVLAQLVHHVGRLDGQVLVSGQLARGHGGEFLEVGLHVGVGGQEPAMCDKTLLFQSRNTSYLYT